MICSASRSEVVRVRVYPPHELRVRSGFPTQVFNHFSQRLRVDPLLAESFDNFQSFAVKSLVNAS